MVDPKEATVLCRSEVLHCNHKPGSDVDTAVLDLDFLISPSALKVQLNIVYHIGLVWINETALLTPPCEEELLVISGIIREVGSNASGAQNRCSTCNSPTSSLSKVVG